MDFSFHFSSLYPAPYIELNWMAGSAQTQNFIWIVWSTLYVYLWPIQRLHLILHLNATHLNKEKIPNDSAIPFNCKFLKRIRIMFPSPFEVRKEKFRWARFHTAIIFKGPIHLERQHFLGGRGKKIGQIFRRKRGGGVWIPPDGMGDRIG